MKIGIITVSVDVAALAKRAEALGFDAFWIPEHTATPVHIAPKTTTYRLHLEPDGTPQPLYRSGQFADPFITLARASAMTQTITSMANTSVTWMRKLLDLTPRRCPQLCGL